MTDRENELRNACAGLLRELARITTAEFMRNSAEVQSARIAIGKAELGGREQPEPVGIEWVPVGCGDFP